MKKYLLLFIVITLTSCQDDLTGHWHTETFDGSFISFNIEKNNDAYIFYSLNSEPIKGEHFQKDNHLFFPSDCGVYAFEYKIKQGKLHLTNALGTQVIAEKVKDTCNRFQDFHTILNIDYLVINNQRGNLRPKDSISTQIIKEYINIDYSRTSESIRLEYFDRISNIQDIDSIMSYIENNYSESEIPFIHYILTPDKHLKTDDLKIIVNKINSDNKIYIRTLKPKIDNWEAFEYIPITSVDLNSSQQLQQIIN